MEARRRQPAPGEGSVECRNAQGGGDGRGVRCRPDEGMAIRARSKISPNSALPRAF